MGDIAVLDEEWDEYEPPYGEPGCSENPFVVVKWVADGARTLSEMALALEAYAQDLRSQESAGWELDEPVDNGRGCLHWSGIGDPPAPLS